MCDAYKMVREVFSNVAIFYCRAGLAHAAKNISYYCFNENFKKYIWKIFTKMIGSITI